MTTRIEEVGDRLHALKNNQQMLIEARKKVLALSHAVRERFDDLRVFPADPRFPLAYRRMSPERLKSL